MSHLELQSLRKRFAGNQALDGVSISLAQGELVSLLGPSGCGKTTALRCVAGFLQPDEGRILIGGDDITRLAPNRRDIGMVFQAYSLFPNMSAAQNVEFGLRVRRQGREERSRRVAELLEIVGLGDAATRYPHELSGGMQQRVALARALAIEPRVLLLDEPLSALDALVRVQLRDEIRRVQTQLGITTLYVTHDQEEALSVSDRVAVMKRGKIEQIGVPAEIYGAPSTRFVAEFIGTMNRIDTTVADPGTVDVGGVRLRVDAAAGREPGAAVLLLVRPESLDLSPLNGHVPEGALAGSVTAQTFLGPVTRIRVAADAGPELVATVPSGSAVDFAVGQRVVARFAPASARVLDSEG
ncbi:MAG: putative spermidine/putrescine transport system ATP-binding protein [Gaiellales bacterium]|nr:putative spermidine/putrescine transport system ATP-binding protein [Gaiellales bacterium]